MSRRCGACGAAAQTPFRAPPPELAPDLDMRPGEPTRSTLGRWLQTCRSCGAVAPDLAALTPAAAAIVASDAYRMATAEPPDALPFVRWSMLVGGQDQAEALLQAAWVADDAGLDGGVLRRRAAAAWVDQDATSGSLRLLDVLRRGGAFGDAEARAAALALLPLDENSARIVAFQRERIAGFDRGRYQISSALRPPARTPHVTHKAARTGSLWARLLGR